MFRPEKLIEIRNIKGWTQTYAARKAGFKDPSYLWQLENGERKNPRRPTIEKLCELYGVSPSYFYTDAASGTGELTQLSSSANDDISAAELLDLMTNKDIIPYIKVCADARKKGISADTLKRLLRFAENMLATDKQG